MEKSTHYRSVTVKRKVGLGPKPRLKRQLKPCTESPNPENQKFLKASSDGFQETSNVKTVEEISVKDDVKERFGGDAEGGGFDVGKNEPEREYESEEYEAGEAYEPKEEDDQDAIKDDLHHDEKEFMCTVLQDEDEPASESEENDLGEEKDRDNDSGVEYNMRNTVLGMECCADEIEVNGDDAMLYDKVGRMDDADAECYHEVVNRPDKNNLELFVGGLDINATEDDIKKVFSKVGEVVNIKLMMNSLTNKNRGFAFLQYATMEQANRALTELKNPVVNGKQCGLEPCKQSNTLFLGNICKQWTQQKLIEKLKSFGIEELKDLRLARDISNARFNRGFAFLEFSSHSDAMSAYKRIQKQVVVLGVDQSAEVCFAYPHVDLRDQIAAKVTRVVLEGVPPSWDDRDVRELVKKFGKIKKIELARHNPSAKGRDCVFVTFYSHDAAIACAKAFSTAEFGKGHQKVKIKVTLSQPFAKSEWKHQLCGNYHLVERPGSGALRFSTDIPTSASAVSMRKTRELKPSKRSSSSGHKEAVGYRDRYPSMPKSRSPRPLPPSPPERSYKRKSPFSIHPKRSMKKDHAGQDDLPPRKRHSLDCGSRIGKSHEIGYPFERYGRSIDSCRGLSYSQTRWECAYETCSHSSLASSHCEADAYDHSSYYGSKRQHSALENYRVTSANSRHHGSRPDSDFKIYESDSKYSDIYGNDYQYLDVYENDSPYAGNYYSRLQRSHPGYTISSRSPRPESQRGCCINQESVYGHRSFGDADDRMYSLSYGSDYMSSVTVQGSSRASVFSRLGPGIDKHSAGSTTDLFADQNAHCCHGRTFPGRH